MDFFLRLAVMHNEMAQYIVYIQYMAPFIFQLDSELPEESNH